MSAEDVLIAAARAYARANGLEGETARIGAGLFLAGAMVACRVPSGILQASRLSYAAQNPGTTEALNRWAEEIVKEAMREPKVVV